MSRVWILGAADPEMDAIDALLRECGERVAYATDERGERVTAATASRATGYYRPPGSDWADTWYETAYYVECDYARPPHRIGVAIRRLDTTASATLATAVSAGVHVRIVDRAGHRGARTAPSTALDLSRV